MGGPRGRRLALFGLVLVLGWIGGVGPGRAEETCPVRPPGDVSVQVEARVEYRPDRRRFAYRYRILPDDEPVRGLATVVLRGEPPLTDVRGPTNGFPLSPRREGSRWFWDARLTDGALFPGKDAEFFLRSPNPPGRGTILLLGHLDYGSLRRRMLEGRLPAACGALFSGTLRDQARAVSTTVPDTYVRGRVSVFPDHPERSLDPASGEEVPVVLHNADTLPLEDLSAGSVRIGPTLTKPRWGSGHRVDVDGDGLVDRLFHVRPREAGVRCGHDHLVLTGWFRGTETALMGLAPLRLRGCG